MNRVVLDFESAYGKHPETGEKITLSSLTTEEYVRHPRFKIHGMGLKVNASPVVYLHGEPLFRALKLVPWDQSFVICHHAHFDGAILSWRLGIRPAMFGCTLSMFRALYPNQSGSLGSAAEFLGLPPKGRELVNFKDKWALTEPEQEILGAYCRNDVEITAQLFEKLIPGFPLEELRLIDTTVRLFTEPMLRLNPVVLREEIQAEQERKQALLDQITHDKQTLMSNDKLAALLVSLGVEPPTKLSPAALKKGQEKLTYAFSKSDEAFTQLLEHENPAVQAVVEARLGVKSTINETRAGRMLAISGRGAWPVYLAYCAANTFRFGGGDKLNPQNLSRGSRLRTCIEAPDGHLLVIGDLAQIEARVLAVLAGQTDVVEKFRAGEDIYCHDASMIFGVKVEKHEKDRRFIGKVFRLGGGYGVGWAKIQGMLRSGVLGGEGMMFGREIADSLGVYLDAFTARNYARAMELRPAHIGEDEHLLHCACAKEMIDRYRGANPAIVNLWRQAQNAIPWLAGEGQEETFIGVEPRLKVVAGEVLMPNGLGMKYHKVRQSEDGKEWTVERRRNRRTERTKLYGGLVVENLCQSLARIVITECMNELVRRGLRLVLQVHDEVVCCSPEKRAEDDFIIMQEVMSTPPLWMPSLPLAMDGGVDKRYVK